jgi:hypothetical protein
MATPETEQGAAVVTKAIVDTLLAALRADKEALAATLEGAKEHTPEAEAAVSEVAAAADRIRVALVRLIDTLRIA